MNEVNLNELYFKWLCSIAFPDESIRNNYLNVLNVLYHTPFEYVLLMDENRKKDGIDLRYHFSYACKIPFDIVKENFDNNNCSVLEMMTALSKRCEEDVMSDISYGDRTHEWFAMMFNNLNLYLYTNELWNINSFSEVKNILYKFMYRDYNSDGTNGNLFICHNSNYDFRNIQIWDQMYICMNEIIYSK